MIYVVLLRGINVGGVKMPMADLRSNLSKLGLRDVKTYLASGNVSFSSDLSTKDVKKKIEFMLDKNYGYTYEIFIYENITEVVGDYRLEPKPNTHRYVIFCRNSAVCNKLANELDGMSLNGEYIQKSHNVIFWNVTIGHSLDSQVAKSLAKSAYKNDLTTRNLQTLQKIQNYISAN